jgi:hypothetical protein
MSATLLGCSRWKERVANRSLGCAVTPPGMAYQPDALHAVSFANTGLDCRAFPPGPRDHHELGGSVDAAFAQVVVSSASAAFRPVTIGEAVMDRSTSTEERGYSTLIGAASLAVGPLVMATGNLLHPKESSDLGRQAAIIAEQATRCLAAARRPRAGSVRWARRRPSSS